MEDVKLSQVTTNTITLINTQRKYYEYVEATGVDPSDQMYQQLKSNRDAAAAAYESELANFIRATVAP